MYIFTNREIAIATWAIILIPIALLKTSIRIDILRVLKSLFNIRIALYIISSIVYFAISVILLSKTISLDASNIKDSVIWFLVSGLILTANSISSRSSESIIRKHILENIKLTVFTEYIVATYVFSFVVEVISLPIIVVLALMQGVAKTDEKYKPTEKLLNTLLSIVGLYVLVFSISSAIKIIKD